MMRSKYVNFVYKAVAKAILFLALKCPFFTPFIFAFKCATLFVRWALIS